MGWMMIRTRTMNELANSTEKLRIQTIHAM